jgi:hypothetical protein
VGEKERSEMRTLIAALLLAIVLAGCGSEGDSTEGGDAGTSPPAATSAASGDDQKGGGGQRERRATRQPGEAATAEPPEAGGQSESQASIRQKALEQIPEEERVSFSNIAALGVLRSLGFPDPEISVDQGGQVVTVTLPGPQVCAAGPEPIRQAASQLKEVILYVKAIKILAEQRLGVESALSYAQHCPRPKLPSVKAPVAFSMHGTGLRQGREFRIKSRRWTLVYQAQSAALDVFVVRGQSVLRPAIQRDTAGVGKVTYRGPGTFTIAASSAGGWRVRVHDGK